MSGARFFVAGYADLQKAGAAFPGLGRRVRR